MIRNLFILSFLIPIILCTACNRENVPQFQFPLKTEDVEKTIADKGLHWSVRNVEYNKDYETVFTLENIEEDTIGTVGIGTVLNENRKVINLVWSLHKDISHDKFDEFYHNELPALFDLVATFYGSSKELKNGFKEFSKYYFGLEESFEGGVYWTKRIGDNHLWVDIKPWMGSEDSRNRLGTFTVASDSAYEYYLKSLSKNWKREDETVSNKVNYSTVAEILEFDQPDDEKEFYSWRFSLNGNFESIKEIKNVPESLKNLNSKYLKPNRDKYLMAKLIDDTGSVDVFLQTTSLNVQELSMKRNHNIVLLYYENNPILIVLNSSLIE